jgi:hypothetical protein
MSLEAIATLSNDRFVTLPAMIVQPIRSDVEVAK